MVAVASRRAIVGREDADRFAAAVRHRQAVDRPHPLRAGPDARLRRARPGLGILDDERRAVAHGRRPARRIAGPGIAQPVHRRRIEAPLPDQPELPARAVDPLQTAEIGAQPVEKVFKRLLKNVGDGLGDLGLGPAPRPDALEVAELRPGFLDQPFQLRAFGRVRLRSEQILETLKVLPRDEPPHDRLTFYCGDSGTS